MGERDFLHLATEKFMLYFSDLQCVTLCETAALQTSGEEFLMDDRLSQTSKQINEFPEYVPGSR
jgi:hypothetical protein